MGDENESTEAEQQSRLEDILAILEQKYLYNYDPNQLHLFLDQ